MPDGKPWDGVERRSRRSRLQRRLTRLAHPRIPRIPAREVRVLRLFGLVALVSVLVLYAVFRSVRFQELLRRKAEQKLTATLRRKVTIGGFDWSFLPPALIVRNVAVANDPRGVPGACLSAAEVELRGIPEWSSRLIDLPKLRVLSPRVVVEVFEDGTSNLPTLPKSEGGGGPDVHLGEAVIVKGTVRFREWKAEIDTVLRGVAVTARSGRFSAVTKVAIACRRAAFRLEGNQVLDFGLAADLTLSPGRVHLDGLRLRGSRVTVDASGGIDNLRKPVVVLDATAWSTGRSIQELFGLQIPLEGNVLTSGTVKVTPGQGFRIGGRFEIPDGTLGPFPMTGSGFIRVDPNGMVLHMPRGTYAGGTTEVLVRLERIDRPPLPVRLAIRARDCDFERFFGDLGLPGVGLMARTDLDATLTFGAEGIEKADGVASMRLTAAPGRVSAVKGRRSLPASGGGPLEIRKGQILFGGMPIETAGGAKVRVDGSLALGTWVPDLGIHAEAADLTELERLASNLYPAILKEPLAPPLRLGGSGAIDARLTRTFSDPRIEGTLRASDFVLRGETFGEAEARFVVDRNVATFAPFTAASDGGRLTLTGRLGFGGPLRGQYRFEEFAADFDRWRLERVLKFLDFDLDLTGRVTGRLPLAGVTPGLTGAVPLVWEDATIWGQKAERVEGMLAFEGDHLRIDGMTARIGSGTLRGGGWFRYGDRGYELALDADALPVERLDAVHSRLDALRGVLSGRLTGSGTVDRPGLSIRADVAGATHDGQALTKPGAPMRIDGTLEGERLAGTLDAPGSARLTVATGTPREGRPATDVRLDVTSLAPYAPFLHADPRDGLDGELTLRATTSTDAAGELVADGALERAEIRLLGRHLRSPAPGRFTIRGGRLELQKVGLVEVVDGPGGRPSSLEVSGAVNLSAPNDLDLAFSGSLDAELARLAMKEGEISGRAVVDLKLLGTASRPLLSGRVLLDGVDYVTAGGTAFEAISGALTLTPGRISADSLSVGFSGGTVDAAGVVGLDGSDLTSIRVNAHLYRVKSTPFEGFRCTVSGDLVLLGDSTLRSARGSLVMEQGLYDDDLRLDAASLLSRFRGGVGTAPRSPSAFDGVTLDVAIDVPPGAIDVRNNVARLKAGGTLSARGTFGSPLLFGRLVAEEGGELNVLGLKYELVAGKIFFSNPQRIEPFFDLSARTQVRTSQTSYSLDVDLSGTMTRLVPRFSSDPALSEAQIVSLLTTGELPGTNSLGIPTGAVPVSSDESIAAALRSVLAQLAFNEGTARTKKLFRLDRLQIDPVFVGSSFDAPRLTVGKALSKDLTVTYSYKASSNQEQVIIVEYQLSPSAFLQAVRDETGVYSLDVKLRQRLR